MARTPRSAGLSAIALAVALVAGASAAPAEAAPPGDNGRTAAPVRAAKPYAVTLITGDTVTVRATAGKAPAIAVKRGKGRENVRFLTARTPDGGLRVLPSDAGPLVAQGQLDARLFDVALLHGLGYDDARTKTIPLIMAGTPGKAPTAYAGRAATTTRALPRSGATAVATAKRDAGSLWRAMLQSPPRAQGVRKVWLDGKSRISLDRSVKQIGAPAAYQAGYTGKGQTIAILDSGYDPTHPDLKGVVTAAKDFTGTAPGAVDGNGHGTHVASIAAGRGTASAGKYAGVAKDAKLVVGKVCDDTGSCPDSALLAGMEWAAQQHVKIVNMSLGGGPSDGTDLLSQAVDLLSADGGPLFVIAAGNDFAAERVSSPSTANSALAVGSVGRTDAMSDFSSRGPRVDPTRRSDYAVKPDITAPGEEIVAAQAAGTGPDGEKYVAYSGTSMATPHAAGAAAILAQRFPSMTGPELKAALMNTAKPTADATVYDQGAGRVDLAAAARTTVTASVGSLSMGYFPWPHGDDRAARKPVTYRNHTGKAVTLALTDTLAGPDGAPAPAAMVKTDKPSVTVPANGTATVQVTLDPRKAAPGLYSGGLTATGGGTTVRTALGTYVEPESYNLNVTTIDSDGQAGGSFSTVFALDPKAGRGFEVFIDGHSGTTRVPAGEYVLLTMVADEVTTLAAPAADLRDGAADVTVDARKGKKPSLRADDPPATPFGDVVLDVTLTTDQGIGGVAAIGPAETVAVVPNNRKITGLGTMVAATLAKPGTEGDGRPPSPYVYHFAKVTDDGRVHAPTHRVDRKEMATLDVRVSKQSAAERREIVRTAIGPGGGVGTFLPIVPTRRTDYVSGGDDLVWSQGLITGKDVDGFTEEFLITAVPDRPFDAGEKVTERWNAAVFGYGFGSEENYGPAGLRDGDDMYAVADNLVDSRPGTVCVDFFGLLTGTTTLSSGGTVIARTDVPGRVQATLPAGAATYRMEVTGVRHHTWSPFSPRYDAVWTFRSARTAEPTPLPLSVLKFAPALDVDNAAPRSGAFAVPIAVEPVSRATPPPAMRTVAVQVSYDDGKTWTPANVTGSGERWTAAVTHPGTAGYVSIRSKATDAAGGTVEQTVIRAYALK